MHGARSQEEFRAAHEAVGPDEFDALLHAGATWTVDSRSEPPGGNGRLATR